MLFIIRTLFFFLKFYDLEEFCLNMFVNLNKKSDFCTLISFPSLNKKKQVLNRIYEI